MNAKRAAELDQHPERATAWELAYAVLGTAFLLVMVLVLVACVITRIVQEM